VLRPFFMPHFCAAVALLWSLCKSSQVVAGALLETPKDSHPCEGSTGAFLGARRSCSAPATTWLLYLSGIRIFLSALICIFLIQRTSELRCRTAISAVNDHGLGYAWGRVRKFYLGTLYLDIQGEPQPPKYTQNVIFGVMKIVDPALSVAVVLSGLKGLFSPLSFVITGTNGI